MPPTPTDPPVPPPESPPESPRETLPAAPPGGGPAPGRRHRIEAALARLLIGPLGLLPYGTAVRLGGGLGRLLLARGANRRRIDANLARVFPDLPAPARDAIRRAACDRMGRVIAEVWSGPRFAARAAAAPLAGPGLAALRAAHDAGRPVVLATAHFGNFYALRGALAAAGMPVDSVYKPLDNPILDARYLDRLAHSPGRMHPASARGMVRTARHLAGGGKLAILFDYAAADRPPLPFLGHPAPTALSAAQMALRHGAALIPAYVLRQPDGLSFVVELESPVPPTYPETMTRALNDSASARIRARPGDWFWPLRRGRAAPPPPAAGTGPPGGFAA